MRFGFHIWISKGFSKVPELARKRRARTIQFFSRNPRTWAVSPISEEEVKKFKVGKDISKEPPHPDPKGREDKVSDCLSQGEQDG